MDPKVFREYDIRGVVDDEIAELDVLVLGKALGTYFRGQDKHRVVVGRDCRLSSERFRERLVEGLVSAGLDVIDIGICPTPVLYFAIRHQDREGGVMITASHNPPEYNGFKVCNGYDTISGPEIQRLRGIFERGAFATGPGQCVAFDAVTPYQRFVVEGVNLPRRLRIGVDAGNAVAGPVALPILAELGCEVHPLYCDMDGTFPNHEPDPTVVKNLDDLMRLVRTEGLDVGIAYDGDGDRVGVVDHRGQVLYGDQLMILFAREILARCPGAVFVSEVKCSKVMYDDIVRHGGRPVMWRTGHSLIKAKMKEVGAALAGEMSGHMFFKDRYFGFDDAIYASCRLLEILAQTGKTIPELLEGVPETFATPEIRIPCPDEIKFEVVARATESLKTRGLSVIDIDGARVTFDDGWGLVRASNTQPVLVLRYEAETAERLEEIRRLVEDTVQTARQQLLAN